MSCLTSKGRGDRGKGPMPKTDCGESRFTGDGGKTGRPSMTEATKKAVTDAPRKKLGITS